jgi:hypothetical protein
MNPMTGIDGCAAEKRNELAPFLIALHPFSTTSRGPHRRIPNWQGLVSGDANYITTRQVCSGQTRQLTVRSHQVCFTSVIRRWWSALARRVCANSVITQ